MRGWQTISNLVTLLTESISNRILNVAQLTPLTHLVVIVKVSTARSCQGDFLKAVYMTFPDYAPLVIGWLSQMEL